MQFIADFHIHSKYSRATSRDMDIVHLAQWAHYKGVSLLGTGDFTHHLWLCELKRYLEPYSDKGLFFYQGVWFILSVEVSNIYSQNNKLYRVHNVIMAPSMPIVEEINKMLSGYGNLASDGRPILKMSCALMAEKLFKISSDIMLIPAHIWTPWFGLFGSKSGFNSLEEAYGKYTDKITALETGLSSNPPMNWCLSSLDKFSLVSNSDAHSPSRIGREANVFNCELNYWQIKEILETKNRNKLLYTLEFFPEEGRYYYDGHRNCKISFHPSDTRKHKGICPVCGRPLTCGVLYRVEELADRPQGFIPQDVPGYKSMVPLDEIIAEVKEVGKNTKTVERIYTPLINEFGSELNILMNVSQKDLFSKVPERIAEGIIRVRKRQVQVFPGFDGEYGTVKVLFKQDRKAKANQATLF